MKHIILASASPRRQELLKLVVDSFTISVADVEEPLQEALTPPQQVEFLAELKARAVAKEATDSIVIGADTLVALDGELLGKPKDEQDAFRMLSELSGQWHQVYTGVSLIECDTADTFSVKTDVLFAELSEEEIWEYIHTGEPMDKAGAYGIQEKGACFVKEIRGDYFSVMGLPVHKIYQKLRTKS